MSCPARIDKPFGGRKKVIVSRLTAAPLCGFVPLHSEFRSAPNVGKRKQARALHQESDENAELRRHGNTVPPVGGHDRWIARVRENVQAAGEIQGNLCAVL